MLTNCNLFYLNRFLHKKQTLWTLSPMYLHRRQMIQLPAIPLTSLLLLPLKTQVLIFNVEFSIYLSI